MAIGLLAELLNHHAKTLVLMSYSPSKLFLRIVLKNRDVYLLKIITLAIAFAASTLVILFALNELEYDRFHDKPDAIFRVLERNTDEHHYGNRLTNKIPLEIYNTLASVSDDSLMVARTTIMKELTVFGDQEKPFSGAVHSADPKVTDIFSFDILDGSIDDFHSTKHSAMICASLANVLFGTTSASGKNIRLLSANDTVPFSVAAVYEDWPQNSHEVFSVFLAFDTAAIQRLEFDGTETGVYGRAMNADIGAITRNLLSKINNDDRSYSFQPLPEIYFGPRVLGEEAKHGDRYSVLILICITSFILFLALTTYVNLTTLTLPYRSKELAVRKLAGTNPYDLFLTFVKESFIVVAVSFVLGLLILLLTTDLIQPILSINLLELALDANHTLFSVCLGILSMLILGPLFLTFKYIKASPNRLLSTEKIAFPRLKKTITILQLGISIFLIVSSTVVQRQVNYSLLKEPGRNYEQVVYLSYPADLTMQGLASIRSGWKTYHPNIVDVIAVSQLPDRVSSKEVNSPFYSIAVDPFFPDFFELNMIRGTWFKPNTDDSFFVLNERGMKLIGQNASINVIGIIDDINSQFNQPNKPIKFKNAKNYDNNYLCVRILEVDIRRTVNYLSSYFDGARIYLLNERFEQWLHYQDHLNTLSKWLGIISGILSCCAVYGLSISLVRDKLNQIAVHKVYGASTRNITILLAREFVRETFFAILIFGPVTYMFVTEFLRNFVYATHLQWKDPVFPLVYCILVVMILCAFQARSLSRKDLTSALKE